MTHFKTLDLPDFLPVVKGRCLQWAEDIVAHGNPHYHLKLRERTFNLINTTPWSEWDKVIDLVGKEKAREIKRRQVKMYRKYGNVNRIVIDQYDVPDVMSEYVKSEMHTHFGIPEDECIPIVQIQDGGEILHPHHGHARKSSLFCLLKGEGEITKWYNEIEPFEHFEEYLIPDIDKLEVSTETTLRENQWLLFNHEDWHSVHRTSDVGVRINFGIDFKTMNINQVMEYFK